MYNAVFTLGEANLERGFSKIRITSKQPFNGIKDELGSALGVPFYFFFSNGFYDRKLGPVVCSTCDNKTRTMKHEKVHEFLAKEISKRRHYGISMDLEEPLACAISSLPGVPHFATPEQMAHMRFVADSVSLGDLQFCTPYWSSRLRYEAHYPLIERLVQEFGPDAALELMVDPIQRLAKYGDKDEALDLIRRYLSSRDVSSSELDALDCGDFGRGMFIQGGHFVHLRFHKRDFDVEIFTDDENLEGVVREALNSKPV